MNEAINIIWRLATAAEVVLALSLLIRGLVGAYPALFSGACFFAVQSLLLILSVSSRKATMQSAWKITEPVGWLLWCWIVLELFSKWTRSYKGIGRFGRFLFAVLMGVALVVSLAVSPIEWKNHDFSQVFLVYYILNRVLMGALALFTLSVWLFFRNYPAAVAPNILRSTAISGTYLGLVTLTQLAFTVWGLKMASLVNLLLVVFPVVCFSAWALLLTRKGEAKESIPPIPPEEIEKTERINRELLELMRSIPEEVGAGKD